MYEIIEGFIEATKLIATFDPDVMAIAARSIIVSFTATIAATLISVPSAPRSPARFRESPST